MIKDGENFIESYSTKFNISCDNTKKIEHDLNISFEEALQKTTSVHISGDDSQALDCL